MRGLRIDWSVLAVTMCLAGAASAGTIYDLRLDWKNATNPHGPWALVQGSVPLPAVPDWTPLSNADLAYNPLTGHIKQPAFAPSGGPRPFLPAWFKAAVTPDSAAFGWRRHEVIVHTTDIANGAGEGIAAAVFTAPASGAAVISGYVYNARNLNRPQTWLISVNGAVKASGLLPGDGSITRPTKHAFNLGTVTLNVGDTVLLQIQEDGGPNGAGDFVGADLKVVYN